MDLLALGRQACNSCSCWRQVDEGVLERALAVGVGTLLFNVYGMPSSCPLLLILSLLLLLPPPRVLLPFSPPWPPPASAPVATSVAAAALRPRALAYAHTALVLLLLLSWLGMLQLQRTLLALARHIRCCLYARSGRCVTSGQGCMLADVEHHVH